MKAFLFVICAVALNLGQQAIATEDTDVGWNGTNVIVDVNTGPKIQCPPAHSLTRVLVTTGNLAGSSNVTCARCPNTARQGIGLNGQMVCITAGVEALKTPGTAANTFLPYQGSAIGN